MRFLAHLCAFLTLAAKEQPYPEDISRTLYKLYTCHISSRCVIVGLFSSAPLCPQDNPFFLRPDVNQHARTQIYPFLQILILPRRLLYLGSMQAICRLSFSLICLQFQGPQPQIWWVRSCCFPCFLLLMFSSVFTSGTVMWGFRSTKLLIRRQGVQARVKGLILGYAVLCSSRSSLYARELCTTLRFPGSFLALWWIFALPAHLP